jgi:hypothetical protein
MSLWIKQLSQLMPWLKPFVLAPKGAIYFEGVGVKDPVGGA